MGGACELHGGGLPCGEHLAAFAVTAIASGE